MQFAEHEICGVIENVWNTMLGLNVVQVEVSPGLKGNREALCSSVEVAGENWKGAISICCPHSLARKAAAHMFDAKEESVVAEHAQDALGELTNMSGGNIKLMLPESVTLLLPQIHPCDDLNPLPSLGRVVSQVYFECEGEPFTVSIHQKDQ
jgi:CheY-specific phosphatase CheX